MGGDGGRGCCRPSSSSLWQKHSPHEARPFRDKWKSQQINSHLARALNGPVCPAPYRYRPQTTIQHLWAPSQRNTTLSLTPNYNEEEMGEKNGRGSESNVEF